MDRDPHSKKVTVLNQRVAKKARSISPSQGTPSLRPVRDEDLRELAEAIRELAHEASESVKTAELNQTEFADFYTRTKAVVSRLVLLVGLGLACTVSVSVVTVWLWSDITDRMEGGYCVDR